MEVLASLFGKHLLMTLHEYVRAMLPEDHPSLLHPSDCARFREFVLRTVVIPCEGPGDTCHLIARLSVFSIGSSLKQILEQVEQKFHFRKHQVVTNDDVDPELKSSGLCWNTIRNHLLNRNWELLLHRVGDEPIRMLLMRCSVFEPLSNGCYLQVSGKVLYSYRIKRIREPIKSQVTKGKIIRCADWLYSRVKPGDRCRLSLQNILNQVYLFEDPAMELLCHIFDLERGCSLKKINRSIRALYPLMRSIIKNHSKVNYKMLLKATCPIPEEHCTQMPESKDDGNIRLLLQCFSTVQNVAKFLRYVFLRVVPNKVWGSKANFAVICRAIHYLVNMKRFDTVDYHNLIKGFKISSCSWIFSNGGRSAALKNQSIFDHLMRWLFKGFLISVIRGCFYCTESEPYRNRIFFYRHEIWSRIQNASLQSLTKNHLMEVEENQDAIAISKLRFLPKLSTVRPLVNCSFRSSNTAQWGITSVNSRLRTSLYALNLELEENSQILGSACQSLDSIYQRIHPFLTYIREISEFSVKPPKVYIVAVDLTKCFDNLKRPRLMEILDRALTQGNYYMYRWASILYSAFDGQSRTRFYRRAMRASSIPQFDEFAESRSHLCRNTVFNEQIGCEKLGRMEILELINDHISRNVIQCNNSFYTQSCGIPQGSVLSTVLCSLYLAELERKELLPVLCRDDWTWMDPESAGVLLRHVDDFLLMTTSKTCAHAFLDRMLKGFDEFNCFVNPAKTRANFANGHKAIIVGDVIPWCGYLFDSRMLISLRADYTRLVGLQNIADVLTVQKTVGQNLHHLCHRRLRKYVMAKINPILLDSVINPRRIVALNIYQIFRFAFIKLCSLLSVIHASIQLNFMKQCFFNILIGFHQTMKRKWRRSSFEFNILEVKYLALYAFKHVLCRKQSRFREVIAWILASLQEQSIRRYSSSKHLQFALSSSENALFRDLTF